MKPVCVVTVERLSEYLAGELDEARAAEMREHLAGCAACRAEEAELAPMFELLARDAQSGVKNPGERYWREFAGRVRSKRAVLEIPKSPWRGRIAWAASIAAVIVLAVSLPAIAPQSDEIEDVFGEEVFLEELDSDELAHVEERLLAAERKKATPTPTVTPTKKRELDETPGDVFDEIVDLEELSDEDLQELLKRIEAIRT